MVTLEFKDTGTPIAMQPVTILWDDTKNSFLQISSMLFETVYKNYDSSKHNLILLPQ
jgi:hypothetical protein